MVSLGLAGKQDHTSQPPPMPGKFFMFLRFSQIERNFEQDYDFDLMFSHKGQ